MPKQSETARSGDPQLPRTAPDVSTGRYRRDRLRLFKRPECSPVSASTKWRNVRRQQYSKDFRCYRRAIKHLRYGRGCQPRIVEGRSDLRLTGHGSVLAVTAQHANLFTPLNKRPVDVSVDDSGETGCRDTLDRVRGFTSLHVGGAYFLMGNGSFRFDSNHIDQNNYRSMSTISGGEILEEF